MSFSVYETNWYWKINKLRKSSEWKIFCQLKLLLNTRRARIMQKKGPPTPTTSNSPIFPLLKDAVHTPDIQYHLIKFWVECKNTLNSQQESIGLFGSTNISPLQNNTMEVSRICISKVLCFVWSASHWDRIIDSKQTHSSGNRTRRILDYTFIDTAGPQTVTVDVNCIHKARFSVQLSVVSIYTCLDEAHKAINSTLLLFLQANS